MTAVRDHLQQLRDELAAVHVPYELPQATTARTHAQRGRSRLEDHIIARYDHLEAPLLSVIGGSTGAGKSTLINSLLQRHISASSAVRPTTRRPVLIHNPADANWFTNKRILPTLARIQTTADAPPCTPQSGRHTELEVRADPHLPPGLALLDAPDLDSVVDDNRQLARQLLDAADLWIFVTTAARYADAVPWQMLKEAAQRDITVTVVLNRIPPGATEEIRTDLYRLLAEHGLAQAPLVCIEETQLTDGFIPTPALTPLKNWLESLSVSAEKRETTARRTLTGAVKTVINQSQQVVDALAEQNLLAADAHHAINQEIRDTARRIQNATRDGTMLRSQVLARWQESIGAADLQRSLDGAVSWVKHKIVNLMRPTTPHEEQIKVQIGQDLAALIAAQLGQAEDNVRAIWRRQAAMAEIEKTIPNQPATQLEQRAQTLTSRWQREVLEMVSSQAGTRKTSARYLAIGVNLLGVALMIVIFASTGGLTGAEVGVAGAASVVAQRLLESVFGDQAVAQMTKKAHEMLLERCREATAQTLNELSQAIPEPSDPESLAQAITRVRNDWKETEHTQTQARLSSIRKPSQTNPEETLRPYTTPPSKEDTHTTQHPNQRHRSETEETITLPGFLTRTTPTDPGKQGQQ